MNEDEVVNPDENDPPETPESDLPPPTESEIPPPPDLNPEMSAEESEPHEMSEPATLGNIFIEPGPTFADLRKKPRFLMAGLIIIVLFSLFQVSFIQKYGFENIVKAQLEANQRVQQMDAEAKQQLIDQQTSPIVKYITYGATPVVIAIVFLVGGLLLWAASLALGGTARFTHGLAVWIYSSFPPAVVSLLINFIVMLLKPIEEVDLATSQGGLVKANPTFFMNASESPVLATVLGSFDVFAIWGWVLAAIGLQKVAKISAASAWAIVIVLFLAQLAVRTIGALLFG